MNSPTYSTRLLPLARSCSGIRTSARRRQGAPTLQMPYLRLVSAITNRPLDEVIDQYKAKKGRRPATSHHPPDR